MDTATTLMFGRISVLIIEEKISYPVENPILTLINLIQEQIYQGMKLRKDEKPKGFAVKLSF